VRQEQRALLDQQERLDHREFRERLVQLVLLERLGLLDQQEQLGRKVSKERLVRRVRRALLALE
jgi:hypothetical protein